MYPVNAEIKRIDSYSGHGDYKEMGEFLQYQDTAQLSKVILVHGDFTVQQNYRDYLTALGFNNIFIPEKGEEITI